MYSRLNPDQIIVYYRGRPFRGLPHYIPGARARGTGRGRARDMKISKDMKKLMKKQHGILSFLEFDHEKRP